MSDDKELIGKTIVCAEIGGYGLRLKFSDGSILDYRSLSDGDSYWEIIDSAKQVEEVRRRVRLIDANAIMDKIKNPYERREIARWVDNAPTIDTSKELICSVNVDTDEIIERIKELGWEPMTHETAIDFLLQEGWLQEHDKILTESAVKHGRWIGKPIAGYGTVRCSVCGDVLLENNGRFPYCPNCGARMDGVKE